MNVRWQVQEIAEARGFNMHSLALEAKLSYNTVRPIWLNQARRADLDTIAKLSGVLKVEPGALLMRVEEAEAQP
jgi:DNA-binding Xre family transcriptional regulator